MLTYALVHNSFFSQNIIKDVIPDIYVHRIMIGGNLIVDTESGFFRDTNRQVNWNESSREIPNTIDSR